MVECFVTVHQGRACRSLSQVDTFDLHLSSQMFQKSFGAEHDKSLEGLRKIGTTPG